MQDPYSTPEAALTEADADVGPPPALWNPDAAGAWSLLLTPVFGSILVLMNWNEIGDSDRARTGKIWVAISILMLIPYMLVPGFALLYIIIWYFSSQKPQTKYVKERWGKDYQRKGWLIPIFTAIGGFFAFFFVLGFVAAMFLPEFAESVG